jgi:isopentenyldiphosphate isomerase
LAPTQLQLGLCRALSGDTRSALAVVQAVAERAVAQSEPQWQLAARALLVEAVAYAVAGDPVRSARSLAEALDLGARWNQFEPRSITELWSRLDRIVRAMTTANATVDQKPAGVGDQDEVIDIYDAGGNSRGQASSKAAHATGLWHRSFHCWIISRDPAGDHKVLLQRRGPFTRSFPNLFDMSVAGHYQAGEGIEGGIRECREELGIEVAPHQLRQVARRIIDETLYSGTINREFQDIYLLELDDPIDSYAIGYPEVSALVECSLRGLVRVVTGEVVSVPCHGVMFDESRDGIVGFDGRISQADLIFEARAYHQTVFPLLSKIVGSGDGNADVASQAGSEVRLSDGSRWVEMS